MEEMLNNILSIISDWFIAHGVKIVLIILIALILRKFSSIFIEKFVRKIIISDKFLSKDEEVKREDTLIRIIINSVNIIIYVVILLIILQECGIEVGPIVAAAGVVGLALGFGGQYLIKDLISGLFIIIENQYRVGDVICLGDKCGAVEDITLRMTTLRDLDGTVHHIAHGEITKVSNLSKYYSRVNLNIGIAYNSDLQKVIDVVNKVGQDMASDPEWKNSIIKAPQFLRIDDFGESAMIIKILGETKPIKQWDVAGELRKRIKLSFDKEGIEIPFPQLFIHK